MAKALDRDNYFESNKRMKEKRKSKSSSQRDGKFTKDGRIFKNDLLKSDYTSQRMMAKKVM
jgi:hypothetical protein